MEALKQDANSIEIYYPKIGSPFLIDIDDYPKWRAFDWIVKKTSRGALYLWKHIRFGAAHKYLYLHRQIMGAKLGEIVDHINRNTQDNRKANLRFVDFQTNTRNRSISKSLNKTSKYKGVHWRPDSKRWRACLRIHFRLISLGCYGSEEEAARAYDKEALKRFGPDAVLNFPEIVKGVA